MPAFHRAPTCTSQRRAPAGGWGSLCISKVTLWNCRIWLLEGTFHSISLDPLILQMLHLRPREGKWYILRPWIRDALGLLFWVYIAFCVVCDVCQWSQQWTSLGRNLALNSLAFPLLGKKKNKKLLLESLNPRAFCPFMSRNSKWHTSNFHESRNCIIQTSCLGGGWKSWIFCVCVRVCVCVCVCV